MRRTTVPRALSPAACITALLLFASTACVREALPAQLSQPKDICPALTAITSVQILLPPGAPFRKNSYVLTDASAVRRVVDFVNIRRDVAAASADVPPSPQLRARFYEGSRLAGIFGTAPGVFYYQCTALSETIRGTRPASAAETGEFQLLITAPSQKNSN